jgi:hypothetical protein
MGMEYRMDVQAQRLIDRKVSSHLQAECASCSNDEDGSVAGTSKDQTVLQILTLTSLFHPSPSSVSDSVRLPLLAAAQ